MSNYSFALSEGLDKTNIRLQLKVVNMSLVELQVHDTSRETNQRSKQMTMILLNNGFFQG